MAVSQRFLSIQLIPEVESVKDIIALFALNKVANMLTDSDQNVPLCWRVFRWSLLASLSAAAIVACFCFCAESISDAFVHIANAWK